MLPFPCWKLHFRSGPSIQRSLISTLIREQHQAIMRFSVTNITTFAGLVHIVYGGFWSDIIDGLKQAHRFDTLFNALTTDLSDDGDAAIFICEILEGDVPDAIAEIPSLVESEVADEVAALTSFVETLPSIVPQLFSDIVEGGEVVVSIIEEIVTAPDAALTVIESGVVSVWSDITGGVASVVSDVTYFIGCDIFGDCPSYTDNGILDRCSSVMYDYSATMSWVTATATAITSLPVGSTSAASSAEPGTAGSTTLASQTTAVATTSAAGPPSTSGGDAGSSFSPSSSMTPSNSATVQSASSNVASKADRCLKLVAIGLVLIVLL
ncbi:hypothetical protein BJ170DRAFT_606658 [Xylariales sp. AK1849]|nr:hypothetical protein BJ170DRAFT_606658 [Xylariales sp. AK1849]